MIYANSYDWNGPAWLRSNDVEGSCTHHPLSNPIQTTKQCNEIDEVHSRNKPFPSQYQPSHQSSSRWWVDRRSPLWSFRENWKTKPHSNKVWNALWTQAKTRLLGAFVQVPCARSLSKSLGTTCCKKAYICFNIYTYIGGWRVTYTHLGTSEIWLKAFKPTSFKWTANRIRRSIFAISCFDRNLCMTPNGQEVWRKSKVVASRSEIVHLTWSLLWRLWRWDAKIETTLNVCWQTHFPFSNTCHEYMNFEIFSHHHHHHHHHHPPSFTFPSSR